MKTKYLSDVRSIMARRHDNGGDCWAGEDERLDVGEPFSTITSLLILHELDIKRTHPTVRRAIQLVLNAWSSDGRFHLSPGRTPYPCSTAAAARVLCRFGYASDRRLRQTFAYLLEVQHGDGGWRCAKFPWGHGPETAFSNPGVTLFALDAFRFTDQLNKNKHLDRAVESLLDHWTVKKPIGPCHFGIGTLFMQIEYPFLRYNLFNYIYVLSFYNRAKRDKRFLEALRVLASRLDSKGEIIVERPHRKLAELILCRQGHPSDLATARFKEIRENIADQPVTG